MYQEFSDHTRLSPVASSTFRRKDWRDADGRLSGEAGTVRRASSLPCPPRRLLQPVISLLHGILPGERPERKKPAAQNPLQTTQNW